mmetsp:Transcript_18196/g.54690  ORF Transcript_18196/g.54690 Transcript_18196/m.54690 type:complete len:296 (+) Transcript_18196:837-1724(+)
MADLRFVHLRLQEVHEVRIVLALDLDGADAAFSPSVGGRIKLAAFHLLEDDAEVVGDLVAAFALDRDCNDLLDLAVLEFELSICLLEVAILQRGVRLRSPLAGDLVAAAILAADLDVKLLILQLLLKLDQLLIEAEHSRQVVIDDRDLARLAQDDVASATFHCGVENINVELLVLLISIVVDDFDLDGLLVAARLEDHLVLQIVVVFACFRQAVARLEGDGHLALRGLLAVPETQELELHHSSALEDGVLLRGELQLDLVGLPLRSPVHVVGQGDHLRILAVVGRGSRTDLLAAE